MKLHLIRFSDLVELWVIKIIKRLWSFARVVRRDHVNRARNADHAARTCESFVYSVVKITRLYDYQTWQTDHEMRKGMWAFLCVPDCAFWMLIGWEDKLHLKNCQTPKVLSE